MAMEAAVLTRTVRPRAEACSWATTTRTMAAGRSARTRACPKKEDGLDTKQQEYHRVASPSGSELAHKLRQTPEDIFGPPDSAGNRAPHENQDAKSQTDGEAKRAPDDSRGMHQTSHKPHGIFGPPTWDGRRTSREAEAPQYIDNPKRYTSNYTGMHHESQKPEGIFGPPEDKGEGTRRPVEADKHRRWADVKDEPAPGVSHVQGSGGGHDGQKADAEMKPDDKTPGGYHDHQEDEVDWGTPAGADDGQQVAQAPEDTEELSAEEVVAKALADLSTQIQQVVANTMESAAKTPRDAARKKTPAVATAVKVEREIIQGMHLWLHKLHRKTRQTMSRRRMHHKARQTRAAQRTTAWTGTHGALN